MGIVYRAMDLLLRRDIALKMITVPLTEQSFKRFVREAQTLAQLNHPNIVSVYELAQYTGNPCVVMEFVQGKTIKSIVEEESVKGSFVPLEKAADYIRQASKGLSEMHKRSIIHRDIKPCNLMLSQNGTVKIMDFGLAKEIDRDSEITCGNEYIGTPLYMPPEQWNSPKEVTPFADIYALGGTFYYLLTAQAPFREVTPINLWNAHMKKMVPSIREKRKDIPERKALALDDMVQKMMAKSPEERYTADHLIDAIDELFFAGQKATNPDVPVEYKRMDHSFTIETEQKLFDDSKKELHEIEEAKTRTLPQEMREQERSAEQPHGEPKSKKSRPRKRRGMVGERASSEKTVQKSGKKIWMLAGAFPVLLISCYFAFGFAPRKAIQAPEGIKALLTIMRQGKFDGAPVAASFLLKKGPHKTGSSVWEVVRDGHSLSSDDQYRFLILAEESCFCYVFQLDSYCNLAWLFPANSVCPEFSQGMENPIKSGQWITVPNNATLSLDENLGIEQFYTVFVKKRWLELEKALEEAGKKKSQTSLAVDKNFQEQREITRGVKSKRALISVPPPSNPIISNPEEMQEFSQGRDGVLIIERWVKHIKPEK